MRKLLASVLSRREKFETNTNERFYAMFWDKGYRREREKGEEGEEGEKYDNSRH